MCLLAVHADDAAVMPVVSIWVQALNTAFWIFEVRIDIRRCPAAGIRWIVRMRVWCWRAILCATAVTNNSSAAVINVGDLRQQAAEISSAASLVVNGLRPHPQAFAQLKDRVNDTTGISWIALDAIAEHRADGI